jgi:hypothetical protein
MRAPRPPTKSAQGLTPAAAWSTTTPPAPTCRSSEHQRRRKRAAVRNANEIDARRFARTRSDGSGRPEHRPPPRRRVDQVGVELLEGDTLSGMSTERHYYSLSEDEARLLDRLHRRLTEFRAIADRFEETQGDGFERHDAQPPARELVDVLRRWLFR